MSGVRGPNSALTEFLRSQGISAADIRRRHEARQAQAGGAERPGASTSSLASEIVSHVAATTEDPEIAAIAQAAANKRKRDAEDENIEGTAICAYCSSRFTLTVYTREVKGGVLCRSCAKQTKPPPKKKTNAASRKQRKQLASAILELKDTSAPSLQDICISTVADYIDDVDELGDLTTTNFVKIARILTKNRRLSPRTVQLFLRQDITELEFWDCSSLTPEAFNLIPAMCPNLKSLTLGMCGQLNDENLARIAALPKLQEIILDGPFLVTKPAWLDFMDSCGDRLTKFGVKSVYRVDAEVLAVMADVCTMLESLSLHRLSQMSDSTPVYLFANLTSLKSLDLSDLEPGVLTDHALTTVLNSMGSQLTSLVVKDSVGSLTDSFVEAVAASCTSLERLELSGLSNITDDAVAAMFNLWAERESNTGITVLSFERCIGVADLALNAALDLLQGSLVELNINSLKLLSSRIYSKLATLPNLTKLDLGFVGSVEPQHVYKFAATNIKLLTAYGNIRLSGMPLPQGITVVGTM